jgi:hypothetical protein
MRIPEDEWIPIIESMREQHAALGEAASRRLGELETSTDPVATSA